jgi:NADH dehydrogenase FAD-containing subunit
VGKHLVLVGGGHAHMMAMRDLGEFVARGHRVTLVSTHRHHYYSGMGPGMLGGTYTPQQVRFHVGKMVADRGGQFIEDRVVRIDAEKRVLLLAGGGEVVYDVVSFNTGSAVPHDSLWSPDEPNVFPVKPIIRLLEARGRLLSLLQAGESPRVIVIGGGPAGVEVTGNVWRLVREAGGKARITIVGSAKLVARFPAAARAKVVASLTRRGVEVREGDPAAGVSAGEVRLRSGSSLPHDIAIVAVGVKPSALFAESGLPTSDDGGLLVNERLQSVADPEIFGGGDCISMQGHVLGRVGVHAVRENPVLKANLMNALEGGDDWQTYEPQETYLLILNLGDGRGLYVRRNRVLHCRPAFWLKDWIDCRFMRRFQLSGELEEPAGEPGRDGG